GRTPEALIPFADGTRLLESDGKQTWQVIDLTNRRRLTKFEDMNFYSSPISRDGRWIVGYRVKDLSVADGCYTVAVLTDTETGQATTLPVGPSLGIAISPDGKIIVAAELDKSQGTQKFRVVVREIGTWKVLASFEPSGNGMSFRFSPGSDRLATST